MTYDLFNTADQIDQGVSGAYELLRNGADGHTGSFTLIGAAFASYLNTEGLAVNGVLNVTGSQQIEGDLTGYNNNHLANLSVTGNTNLSNVTGTVNFNNIVSTGTADVSQFINGIDVSGKSTFKDGVDIDNGLRVTGESFFDGDVNINGDVTSTGALNVTGSFTINGSGLNDAINAGANNITGDAFAFFTAGKGQLIVGTGEGTGVILDTGGAQSGYSLTYNPASPEGIEWQAQQGGGGGGGAGDPLTGFYGATTSAISFTDGIRRAHRIYPNNASRVDVSLNASSSGAFYLSPTGMFNPTDPRRSYGAYAVDLQLFDNSELITGEFTGAAIGHYSSIGGGNLNTAVANFSRVGGGHRNTIDGEAADREGASLYSFIGCGRHNELKDATNSAILGGTTNTIKGSNLVNSFVIGSNSNVTASDAIAIGVQHAVESNRSVAIGYQNDTSAIHSLSLGYRSDTTRYGEIGHAAGFFSARGDSKTSILTSRNSTSTASQTELFLDGTSERIVIPANSSCNFVIYIVGQESAAATGNAGSYKIEGTIKRLANTTSLVGSITTTTFGEDDASWSVTAEADDTNEALVIKVTGAASTNIRWVATTLLTQVTYA